MYSNFIIRSEPSRLSIMIIYHIIIHNSWIRVLDDCITDSVKGSYARMKRRHQMEAESKIIKSWKKSRVLVKIFCLNAQLSYTESMKYIFLICKSINDN